MQAFSPFQASKSGREGSLLEGFGLRIAEAVVRRQSELAVNAARIEADLAIRARSQFLANMNHELRTPLNAIIGFATMLRDIDEYDLGEEKRRDYAGYVLQSADLLLGHINTILEVAALESGGVEVVHDNEDVALILTQCVDRARVRAGAAEVSIEVKTKVDVAPSWVDGDRLAQAIDHLIQSAVKCCDQGGRILVRALVEPSGWVGIDFRDNGSGLTPEEIKNALNAFDHVHSGLDRSFEGPGVELAIAKTFVEMMGGRFSIKSRVGEGTLIRLMLPPSQENEDQNKNSAETLEAPLDMRKAG